MFFRRFASIMEFAVNPTARRHLDPRKTRVQEFLSRRDPLFRDIGRAHPIRWSLLIVRDALIGVRRFSDFQKSLGLAKNVLSARLKKLVARGIMEQVPASDGSAYREYALTQKGWELFPVIVALGQWGGSYLFSRGEKRLQVLDKRTRKPFRVQVHNAKGEILTANDLELVTVTN